jgi:hypothetical protein
MPWRAQFGQRGSAFGAWVSKPGIDVTTAQPGQFLLDISTQVYQAVLAGDTGIVTNPGVGNYTATVTLPAAFSAYSRLVMWAHLYELNTGDSSVSWDDNYNGRFDGMFRIVNGVLTLTATSTISYAGVNPPRQLRIAWSIFRAVF